MIAPLALYPKLKGYKPKKALIEVKPKQEKVKLEN